MNQDFDTPPKKCDFSPGKATPSHDFKNFLVWPALMILFSCQRGHVVELFTYFQRSHMPCSFDRSSATILFFKYPEKGHLSWISNFHALKENEPLFRVAWVILVFDTCHYFFHISSHSGSKLCWKSAVSKTNYVQNLKSYENNIAIYSDCK